MDINYLGSCIALCRLHTREKHMLSQNPTKWLQSLTLSLCYFSFSITFEIKTELCSKRIDNSGAVGIADSGEILNT